jgi:hypothetical protein
MGIPLVIAFIISAPSCAEPGVAILQITSETGTDWTNAWEIKRSLEKI